MLGVVFGLVVAVVKGIVWFGVIPGLEWVSSIGGGLATGKTKRVTGRWAETVSAKVSVLTWVLDAWVQGKSFERP